ncbi:glutathione S-transferase N-terminal domain-containing protein [soil metagenome]
MSNLSIAGTSLEPLLFWKSGHSVTDAVNFARSSAATLARLGSGGMVAHVGPRPAQRLELYERESCPFSRKVREALSILDLDVIVHPCPEGGTRFRAKVEAKIGKYEIPVLVDPNRGIALHGSDEIVEQLFAHYGDGKVPLTLRSPKLTNASSKLASALRGNRGTDVEPSLEPTSLIELYSYEASPYCRPVREKLTELELPYLLHNVARGSARRPTFIARSGKMQVPYLVDAAREVAMFESKDIVDYLEKTYAAR